MKKFIDENLLAVCVLLAAVLISGSLIYSTNLIVKDLNPGGNVAAAANNQNPSGNQPSGQIAVADRNGQPVLGNANAKVTIYEFSDFQCPYCENFYSQTLGQIETSYINTGKAKLIFRYYPLPFHNNAEKAAEAAECANTQGKFWQYHDLLFKNGQSDGTGLAVTDLKNYAEQLGLDTAKFNTCLDTGETADIVKKDTASGSAAGVTGTPTFFVNGKELVGAQPFSSFQQSIDEALKK